MFEIIVATVPALIVLAFMLIVNRALRARVDHAESIIESIPCVLTDGTSGTILFATGKFCELFGYGHGELTGMFIEMLIPDDKKTAHIQHRIEYVEKGTRQMACGCVSGWRKDGTTIEVEVLLNTISTDGQQRVLAIVTEKK